MSEPDINLILAVIYSEEVKPFFRNIKRMEAEGTIRKAIERIEADANFNQPKEPDHE